MTAARAVIFTHAKPAYLTPQAFADHFCISKMSAYRLMHIGAVKWVRVGRSMRIPVAELARFAKDAESATYSDVWGES